MSSPSRDKYIYIGAALAGLGILLSNTYRVYIYSNGINDFYLADTIGSLLCVPAGACFLYGLSKKESFDKVVLYVLFGNILYELFALTSWHGVFDWFDMAAILVGTVMTLVLSKVKNPMKSKNVKR
jgi:hypothetical protein